MIGYVTLGTSDLVRAAAFYDAIAAELGVGRMMDDETFIAWGKPGGGAGVGLTKPFDGKPATVGNGVMVALEASDRAQVDKIYQIALANGGSDEVLPAGARASTRAYFRDPDGNKLNAFTAWAGRGSSFCAAPSRGERRLQPRRRPRTVR